MNNTCIQHPTRDPLIVIRQWQLDFCEGNHCAAALLSFFEYWHNIRLDMSQRAGPANAAARPHGKPATQDESLLQFHSDEQLHAGLLGLYGTMKIREARRLLVAKGALTEHLNPKPRYAFDRTIHYLFHPEVVNIWLVQRHSSSPPEESAPSGDDSIDNVTCAKNGGRVAKNGGRVAKNGACSQEITTETTTDTTTTTPYPSSSNERPAEPEPERGGGVQDQNPEDQGSAHGIAALEPNEEKTVNGEKAQTAEVKRQDNDTSSEIEKMTSSEHIFEEWVELVYPAKLTEHEQEDIAAQVYPLPPEVAQQMLDVIQSRIQSGQIRTNPAAVLRGIVRKYQADASSFDPSSGFQIAEARRRRTEIKAREQAEAERRAKERAAVSASPLENTVARQSIAAMRGILRGHRGEARK